MDGFAFLRRLRRLAAVDVGPLRRYRDFRMLFMGQVISIFGGAIRRVAMPYQIYSLTHSPLAVGVLGLFAIVPIPLLALLGGALADARDRRRMVHAAALVAATSVPVSADLENGYADDPAGVAETVRLALQAGLAGCSIEDSSGRPEEPIYERGQAVERVRAAAETAHGGPVHLVLTARAENYLHGRPDLDDTIERLQRYQEVGADALYAPGMTDLDQIATVVRSVDRPVNVLLRPSGPSVAELTAVGVRRVSVGGAFAFAALGALVEAARELQAGNSVTFFERTRLGSGAVREAFGADGTR